MAARHPSSRPTVLPSRSLRSWVPIDADYGNRSGFDPRFLGGVIVSLPRVDGKRLKAADLLPTLSYQHFSVRMHQRRKLAAFTAVNISGAERYQRTGREKDSWEEDPRAVGFQTTQPAYKAPFHRGHLVMRLDPVWGGAAIAERAEADTFAGPTARRSIEGSIIRGGCRSRRTCSRRRG